MEQPAVELSPNAVAIGVVLDTNTPFGNLATPSGHLLFACHACCDFWRAPQRKRHGILDRTLLHRLPPMLRSAVAAALLMYGLPIQAAAVEADRFAPCADIAEFPELADSLCLTTSVPLRHESPDGTSIELSVRRFPATEPASRRGEIWLVAGGPGEPGASFHPLLPTFRQAFPHYDLVLPDHRGTGGSERLCPKQESLDSPDGVALAGEEWGPCIGALYADTDRTSAFTITQAAHDLSTLLTRHRGDGEVLLYSVSYGTQLALRMLQAAPPALDGLILDGLVPPENEAKWDLSHRTAVVDEVGRAFLGEAQAMAYQRLLDTAAPEAAWRSHVPGGDLRRFFGALLNFPTLRARIPSIVDELSGEDDAELRATVADLQTMMEEMTRHPLSPPSLPLVMLISASENNERRDLSRETVEAEAEAALFTSPLPGFLVDSPVPRYERDEWFGSTPASLPRTLVIHGTLDPNTPYAGARAHAEGLAEAGPLTFSTVHRGAHLLAYVAPTCFIEVASAFVEGTLVPERCTEPGQEP
ncbi:alpha/beta hydrolase [Marilutibacter alkalisoli]|nr:alpha/beta hydrolase [Lysobacter alkalisoli]